MTRQGKPNRLAFETSPYLLQHAQNPVEWFPWGDEALGRAKSEDKPIFLSIGYAACHWCHVMEHESFEDDAVAEALNAGFIAIKVDREERPDIDAVYMAATVAMSGAGGWPMSVFLTPAGEPFFAGTYFPKTSRYGRPGFMTLLERIGDLWRSERAEILAQAKQLTRAVALEAASMDPRAIESRTIDAAAAALRRSFDPRFGGFGGAPKFPASACLSLLLRSHARTGDAEDLRGVVTTLDRMAEGGIFDHLAGGFARYSTDAKWHVPHFEKMLYDNAQLARVYAEAWQVTGERRFADVARRTLDYVAREMQGEHGGYFSATDADSEGVEGKYFVWSLAEIEALCTAEDAAAFAAAYDVSEAGNWEGTNVLWTPRPMPEVARELSIDDVELARRLSRARAQLLEARQKRVPPLLDDKVLASWNGLMIGTMAFVGRALGEPRYLASAGRAAAMLRDRLTRDDGGLYRTFREGRAHIPAFLEDYAFVCDGLIDLFEASSDPRWLATSLRLAERAVLDFAGEPGDGFYTTARDGEALVVRMREGQDGATPSANAVLSRALVRLATHTSREDLREVATRAILAHGAMITRAPRAFATSLDVLERLVAPPIEVAVVGAASAPDRLALERVVGRTYLPHAILVGVDPSVGGLPEHPALAGKTLAPGVATAHVCRNFACHAPVTDPADLARELGLAMRVWCDERTDAVVLPAEGRARS